ncbi:CoA-binding protein [Mucilaginibacter sp.]|uniref:CoA-binding protein n=1 Tax=Mucilaginibacter sp. TaxID=1882438 RepID=UPI00284593C4|nr:CoA-binding protein [Mucilaginibacter sp.]MDR3696082.1 CoA-binding protein [Mucilaginibacter sp.]
MRDNNPQLILKNAQTILLVDWPDADVPRLLVSAGFMVFGYSPDNYTSIGFRADGGGLVFTKVPDGPGQVDIVNVFRPEEEHAGIIARHVLPLKAKVLWLHPPVTAAKTAAFAKENGLVFVDRIDITVVANELSAK